MKLGPTLVIALVASVLALSAVSARAATLVVTKTDDTADGICDADCSLREAVAAAAGGDVLVFAPLFNSSQTIRLTNGQIAISKNLTISGPGAHLLNVSGNNAGRVLSISGGANIELSGMTLRDGLVVLINSPGAGGAILLSDSQLTLINMTLRDNRTGSVYQGPPPPMAVVGYGGAIYGTNSTLNLFHSTVTNNVVPQWPGQGSGGGIYTSGTTNVINSTISNNLEGGLIAEGTVYVADSTIDGNTGAGLIGGENLTVMRSRITNNPGWGVLVGGDSYSTMTIERSVISHNSGGVSSSGWARISKTVISNNRNGAAFGKGGGVRSVGTMYIVDSAIVNNWAYEGGGGVYHPQGKLYITSCTVSGNTTAFSNAATSLGAGIYTGSIFGGTLVLTGSTIANNTTLGPNGRGGGIYNDNTATVKLRNTIIGGNNANTSSDVRGDMTSEGFNLIGNTAGSTGWLASDILNQNPRLGLLADYGGMTFTHAILPNSPALNAGSYDLAFDPLTNVRLLQDQRGLPRYEGPSTQAIDIGAYEAGQQPTHVTLTGRVVTATGRGISFSRVALTDLNGSVRYTVTNPFGYFRFADLAVGLTYNIIPAHKYYGFTSSEVTIASDPPIMNILGN